LEEPKKGYFFAAAKTVNAGKTVVTVRRKVQNKIDKGSISNTLTMT
jgi:hypothetical protein